MTSLIFRMDSLLAGTRFLPWEIHCAGVNVQRHCVCGNHPGPSRKPFRARANAVRLSAGITVRLQPGIVFTFAPEPFSRPSRNPVHLRPGILSEPLTEPQSPTDRRRLAGAMRSVHSKARNWCCAFAGKRLTWKFGSDFAAAAPPASYAPARILARSLP
jgi:hypothetical protein